MDSFVKQTKISASDAARKVAKQIAREPIELLKTSKSQVLRQESDTSRLVQEMVSGNGESGEISETQKVEIEAKKRKRIEELEEELKRIRHEREKKEEEWSQLQQQKMGTTQDSVGSHQPFIEPTTKPRRGFMGFLKKKQGTKEMGKQISG
ncbi:MAG: hypothetical protein UT24_C0009G0086 [Candidatus Woesebacteria bacterium GW2011_GWB1_39_12]|uniref:Uncharacterized protein n=2 Tax=Candidatus Woeseibacteriota TaxID=1752722 RepID=A0A0G0QA76_9BACT|nr:MAG: hypothetical protein UT23_C0002G0086 [Candidatus Woesebacteria bacterium GW2011_GWA1_39_12]KKR00769.1 MAG: hypothetical protein UT24_C0009G0086 [Candidatus Woesebacteria bacterium GW2011_GWB1_39_12]